QRLDHLAVMRDAFRREAALARLDSAPFEREAMRVVPEVARQREVFSETPEMIASLARLHLHLAGVFPRRPVVVGNSALDLLRRGRRAPEEVRWELEARGIRPHDGDLRREGLGLGLVGRNFLFRRQFGLFHGPPSVAEREGGFSNALDPPVA